MHWPLQIEWKVPGLSCIGIAPSLLPKVGTQNYYRGRSHSRSPSSGEISHHKSCLQLSSFSFALHHSLLFSSLLGSLSTQTTMAMAMPQGNAIFPRSHVGFDSITQQIEKKLLKRGKHQGSLLVTTFQLTQACRIPIQCHLCRTIWSRKVHPHQYHLRFPSAGIKRTFATG